MRATQKKMMALPVTSTEEGRNTSRSLVFSGQPSEEKGTRAEENHVSRTSGSRRRDFCFAICRASFSLRATKILPCSSYHAGIWWPHQSWREMHQRSEEHTSELQSLAYLVCRLLLEKKKKNKNKSC